MRVVRLHMCTRTLKMPDLQDVYDTITNHAEEEGPLCIDLQGLRIEATDKIIKGSAISPVHVKCAPHTSLTERHLVFAAGTVVHICNGTLVIPSGHALLLSGANITFNNVCIIGEGLQKSSNPYLICVHGANSTTTFDNTILESENSHSNSNTLVVQRGAICHINSSRVFASEAGNALKVQGGQVFCRKRSLIQGGILVTSGGDSAPAVQIDRETAQWHRSKGRAGAAQQQKQEQQQQQQTQQHEGGQQDDAGKAQDQDPQGGCRTGQDDERKQGPSEEAGPTSLHHASEQQPSHHQQQHYHLDQQQEGRSCVMLRNSEIRGGTVTCIATFGSGSQCDAEGCIIGHGTTFGCHAAKRSSIKLVGCKVASCVVGAVVTGSGFLTADKCTIEGGQIGVLAERQGTAQLLLSKLISTAAPAQAPPLPSPPKPGFLPTFQILPAAVEVRHPGSTCTAVDCKMGSLDVGQGEHGVHCIDNGRFAGSAGVAAAIEGVKGQFQDFFA